MRRGFTLLELLIAAALLSGLLTATFFAFTTVQRGLAGGGRTFDFVLQATALGRRLDLLVGEASPYPEAAKDTHFKGNETKLVFTTLRGATALAPPRFVTLDQRGDEVLLTVDRLRWLVDSPEEGTDTTTTLTGVRSLRISYSDGSEDAWKDSWDAATAGKLPRLVKLRLDMTSHEGQPFALTVVARPRLDRDPSIR